MYFVHLSFHFCVRFIHSFFLFLEKNKLFSVIFFILIASAKIRCASGAYRHSAFMGNFPTIVTRVTVLST